MNTDIPDNKTLVSTHLDQVKSSPQISSEDSVTPCGHEEADTRLLLHANHASQEGHKRILIRTVDSDVVVLALSAFHSINVTELWVFFGVGKHKRYIPIHQLAENLGLQTCQALPFWHAFTGCDTTSAFAGRGKKTAWDVWRAFPEVTATFISLSMCPNELTENHMAMLERYTVLMYDRTSSSKTVNECRQMLFTKKNRLIDNLPPTRAALKEHTKRAVLQGGHK